MQVNIQVKKVIKQFHSHGKYIGVASNSILLVAKVLGRKSNGPGVELTLGWKGQKDVWP